MAMGIAASGNAYKITWVEIFAMVSFVLALGWFAGSTYKKEEHLW